MSPAAVEKGLLAGLHSSDEVIVDPREAIRELPGYLQDKYGVHFIWNEAVIATDQGLVITGQAQYECDLVVVCSGVEFETLFPDQFTEHAMTKCKLQMMRLGAQPDGWRMGPAMCGGLSLTHYHSFRVANSLQTLKKRVADQMPGYVDWGIHVMVSQNGRNELTVGDSHEYGGTHDPFDRAEVNELILDYLRSFARFPNEQVVETWNGVYAKMSHGEPYLFTEVEPGIFVFNGLGGAGMTLSFGLSVQLVEGI
jgi:FAD dependent oxidoreductase TIGR03364